MASAEPAAAPDGAELATAPGHADAAVFITVELAFGAAAQQVERLVLRLPAGATALDALRASGLGERLGPTRLDALTLGLWGRTCTPGTLLRDLDRLELLRPLLADPMEARRKRLRRDGLRKVVRRR
jgi:hypothetical protein